MEDLEFNPMRGFRIWEFRVGHGFLLLRSLIEESRGRATRFDIAFGGTQMIDMPTGFCVDLIRLMSDGEQVELLPEQHREFARKYGYKVYGFFLDAVLQGKVVCGSMKWHEDFGTYRDKSFFDQFEVADLPDMPIAEGE